MQDARKACQLIEKCANDYNDMLCIKTLGGQIYITGSFKHMGGVRMDFEKGIHWLLRGAQGGDGHSVFQKWEGHSAAALFQETRRSRGQRQV